MKFLSITFLTIILVSLRHDFGDALSDFEADCLKQHNYYRSCHGYPPMEYNATLSEFSKAWAKMLLENGTLFHSHIKGMGENLYCCHSSDKTYEIKGSDPVTVWYNEMKDYDFDSDTPVSGTGHFSQVIWKGSTQLGIGVAKKCENGKVSYVVVTNYYPAGNCKGLYKKNVCRRKV